MKKLFVLTCLVAFAVGCFHAGTKSESLHSKETYNSDGKLASREVRRDRNKGGGTALLADPKASALARQNVNQKALGGGSTLNVGEIESVVSTNGIKAVGTAGGELINTGITGN